MTLLPLPWGLGQSTIFKSQNATPTRTECESNHTSKCQTLSATKSKAKRAFWKEILRKSNYTKIDAVGSEHAFQGISHWKFPRSV